jgi:3',5'-cyclic AMP phosphodiesterase CpdA
VSFTLAHLSDAHLANLGTGQVLKNFEGKRIIGAFSWFLKRRRKHKTAIADTIRSSILMANPDHIAFTGDAINIAAWDEFPAAAKWMQRFGSPDRMSFVPGNHDAYVHVPWSKGLAHFAPWMKPDRSEPTDDASQFPYVRMRRNVALIGLNSGKPQNYLKAAGTLGVEQLRDLQHILGLLGSQGFYRIIMIHHPPLPGLAIARKALTDAAELKAVLVAEGCELVLHGHNHKSMLNWLDTKSGPTPVIGAPSASLSGDANHEPAGWNHFHIRRLQGRWTTDLTPHRWNKNSKTVEHLTCVTLSPP